MKEQYMLKYLFYLYILPATITTYFGYIFPSKGNLLLSARRKKSRGFRFILATSYYLLALYFVIIEKGV